MFRIFYSTLFISIKCWKELSFSFSLPSSHFIVLSAMHQLFKNNISLFQLFHHIYSWVIMIIILNCLKLSETGSLYRFRTQFMTVYGESCHKQVSDCLKSNPGPDNDLSPGGRQTIISNAGILLIGTLGTHVLYFHPRQGSTLRVVRSSNPT